MSKSIRKILHIDMDAFYAAVEQRDDPSLRGLPVAVGGAGKRAVVMTASYEARRFGVHSAMPATHARRLCPDLIFVPPRFAAYKEVAEISRRIFKEYTHLVEPLSLDEAFLDVTHPVKGPPSATLIAKEVKQCIHQRTGLTASAGVATNKFLAKVASGMNKPDGLTVVRPEEAKDFVAALPIEKFFGVGPATAKRFQSIGVRNGADLRMRTREELLQLFGKAGHWYYRVARGIDNRPVSPTRERKSISAERTFGNDLVSLGEMLAKIHEIADAVARRMEKTDLTGRTVTIKIRYHDFTTCTRSRTVSSDISEALELRKVVGGLLRDANPERPVRLLGIGVAKLHKRESEGSQLTLDLT